MKIELDRPTSSELEKWRIYAEQLERYCCFLETTIDELSKVKLELPTGEEWCMKDE